MILAELVIKEAKELEVRLKKDYSISELIIEVSSFGGCFTHQIKCQDSVEGFILEYDNDYHRMIEKFTKRLTKNKYVKAAKIAQAKKLLAEAES